MSEESPAHTMQETIGDRYGTQFAVSTKCIPSIQDGGGSWSRPRAVVVIDTVPANFQLEGNSLTADSARRLAASILAAADQCERWEGTK